MAPSTAFVVELPEMNDEQLERVAAWAKGTCLKNDIVMSKDGNMRLVAVRKEAKDVRGLQRLFRTNFQNWGVELPVKQAGWIRTISEDQYEAMLLPPGKAIDPPVQEESGACGNSPNDTPSVPLQIEQPCCLLKLPVNLLRPVAAH